MTESVRAQIDRQALATWRADTPGCARRSHFNNAGAALMPQPVLDAMTEHLLLEREMGGYEAADLRAEAIELVYTEIAALVAGAPRNMAIVSSATAGFVQALSSVDFAPGDEIVTSRCDYTSNQIQYLALARRRGVRIVHAADRGDGGIDPDAVRDLLRRPLAPPRKRIVALSWIPTNSGLVQDVESVGAVCAELDVPYLLDACQAIGQKPIDVGRLRCDYLSVTARKFLRGPRGIGFMYASDRALARGDHPLFVDMRGARWVEPDRYQVAESARRFEEWEHSYALVLGLGAAAAYARGVGIDVAGRRASSLARRVRQGLAAIPGVRVLDRGQDPCAIVSAAIDGMAAADVAAALAERGINTSSSLRWYGIFDFDDKQVDSSLRISPHYYNTEEEVDALLAAVAEIVTSRRRG
jgi:selenocysteine lyase/cysteine desulfurase